MHKLLAEILDAAMIAHHRKNQEKRNYLGASIIGDDCLRKIQLQYMRSDSNLSAQILRTFDVGHVLEKPIANWLRIAGFNLKTHDDKTGEQFGFSVVSDDGIIAGHVDGIIYDFPPKLKLQSDLSRTGSAWLWECKTMNDKNWRDINKRGLLVSRAIYYAQIQIYMAYMKLDENPCLFTALNKDTSELYFEFVPFDAEAAQRYSDRAAMIIRATKYNEILPCISQDPTFFKCRMCSYRQVCLQQRGIRE